MNSFEQEFYRSTWRRVLPLGPHGIQPYVRTDRRSGLPAGQPGLRRLATGLRTLAQRLIGFGRWTAIGTTRQPVAFHPATRGRQSSLPSVPRTVRPATPWQGAPRRLSDAA
jgi:hypothetical protein